MALLRWYIVKCMMHLSAAVAGLQTPSRWRLAAGGDHHAHLPPAHRMPSNELPLPDTDDPDAAVVAAPYGVGGAVPGEGSGFTVMCGCRGLAS